MQRIDISIESTACLPYSPEASNKTDKIASASDRSGSGAASLTSTDNFASASDRPASGAAAWQSDNFVSALDGIGIECNPDNQTTSSVHLIVRDQMQPLWHRDNRQRASDDIDIRCSSLAIRQPPVHLTSSRSNAAIWALTASHLIALRLNAACLTSHSIVSASDGIDIRCSIFDIKINSLSAHSLIAAPHLFNYFFTLSGAVERLSYTFIWSNFIQKTHQSSAF